jgi:hypothetical protein
MAADEQHHERGDDGYLRVDYARIGLRLQTWDQWAAAHWTAARR